MKNLKIKIQPTKVLRIPRPPIQKYIVAIYVDVSELDNSDVSEYIKSIADKLIDTNMITYVIPIYGREYEKIEVLNPRPVSDIDFEKLEAKLDRAFKAMLAANPPLFHDDINFSDGNVG
jgi:restriction endonuclease S subunit